MMKNKKSIREGTETSISKNVRQTFNYVVNKIDKQKSNSKKENFSDKSSNKNHSPSLERS